MRIVQNKAKSPCYINARSAGGRGTNQSGTRAQEQPVLRAMSVLHRGERRPGGPATKTTPEKELTWQRVFGDELQNEPNFEHDSPKNAAPDIGRKVFRAYRLHFAASSGRLHVTIHGSRQCHLVRSAVQHQCLCRLAIRSEPIASGCAREGCARFRFGCPTHARRLLRLKPIVSR
jgi:hypothetical protein